MLKGRAKAVEGSFFKAETDTALLQHARTLPERTAAVGQASRYAFPTHAAANDMLPEVLAHHLPVDRTRMLAEMRKRPDYFVHRPASQAVGGLFNELTRKTYVDQVTLGSTMSTGRSKWAGGIMESEKTSIWNVGDASRLMMDSADQQERRMRLRYVVPPKPVQTVSIAGTPFRMMPEPTAGRALFWGTIAAACMGAAAFKTIQHGCGITSVDDVKPKLQPALAPVARWLNELTQPIKDWRQEYNVAAAADGAFALGRNMKHNW